MYELWQKANIHIVPFQFVKNSHFKILHGSVATLFRWSWKISSDFVANLSKTLRINFYRNWSSIVDVMTKNGAFYAPECKPIALTHECDSRDAYSHMTC